MSAPPNETPPDATGPRPLTSPVTGPKPVRPVKGLLRLALLAVPLMVGTLGFSYQYLSEWLKMRAFRNPVARRLAMQGPPYFRADYMAGVERLKAVIPEDAKILIDVGEMRILLTSNRWHLLLNNDLYPRQVYTRAPEFSGATLVEYTEWLRIQLTPAAMLPVRDQLELEASMQAAGIDWWLIQPLTQRYLVDEIVLRRRNGSRWEDVEIPPLRDLLPENPWKERKQRLRDAKVFDDDELMPQMDLKLEDGR